jgi:hypothetical protein
MMPESSKGCLTHSVQASRRPVGIGYDAHESAAADSEPLLYSSAVNWVRMMSVRSMPPRCLSSSASPPPVRRARASTWWPAIRRSSLE